MNPHGEFARLLNSYLQRMKIGAYRLAKEADIPKPTIEGWLKGRRPRDWRSICRVVRVLAVSRLELDLLLAAADFPRLDVLLQRPLTESDRALLAHWTCAPAGQQAPPDLRRSRRDHIGSRRFWIGMIMLAGAICVAIVLIVSAQFSGADARRSIRSANSLSSPPTEPPLLPKAAIDPLFTVLFEEGSFEGSGVGVTSVPAHFTPRHLSAPPFEAGRTGTGVRFTGRSARLSYPTARAIHPEHGRIEFWLKPLWNGGDEGEYVFFEAGNEWFNRFRIAKDAANNFRFIVWSASAEYGIAYNIADKPEWEIGAWHHVRVTWRDQRIELYLDGKLVDQRVDVTLPAHLDDRMYIGSASPNTPDALFAEAVIDDFAIYKE